MIYLTLPAFICSASDEGPNEHDIALLNFGYIFAVIRFDAGDGPKTHRFSDYYSTGNTHARIFSSPPLSLPLSFPLTMPVGLLRLLCMQFRSMGVTLGLLLKPCLVWALHAHACRYYGGPSIVPLVCGMGR